jgi:hypothetical protein
MNSILYYSNYCNHSKTLLQSLSKINLAKDTHFICIDKRIKDENNKIHIILENGQKIIMPEKITRVPALLLLNNSYDILYGEEIPHFLKKKQDVVVKQATSNNLEPSSFSFSPGGFGIVSDQYSFLDMDTESLSTKGNGGIRQMHSYVDLNYNDTITTPPVGDSDNKGSNKISSELTIAKLQEQREKELKKL